jgi:cation transport regulator ChaB
MPYQDIKDLPDSVKNHLPKHAASVVRICKPAGIA